MTLQNHISRSMSCHEQLFDQTDIDSLGLDTIPGHHVTVYHSTNDGCKYAHHPHLGVFHDRLYLMWSVGRDTEDSPSQHVVYAHSDDGLDWSSPILIGDDPDGEDGPMRRTAGGWHISDDTFVAYFTTYDGKGVKTPSGVVQKWSDYLLLEARTSTDGIGWSQMRPVLDNFLINEPPRFITPDRLLMTGENAQGVPRLVYTDSPSGLTDWRDGRLPKASDASARLAEPTWYRQAGGQAVMVMRDDSASRCFYVSVTADSGLTWSIPNHTTFPDSCSKPRAGTLPCGTTYLINNAAASRKKSQGSPIRIPLVITTSSDGVLFDWARVLRNEPTKMRYEKPGEAGYAYPSTVVWRDHLCVAYSINKEDISMTQIPLARFTSRA